MGIKLDGYSEDYFGLVFLKDHYHPATPEMRNRTMSIPGMPGEWDFGSEWGSRPFTLPFALIDYDRYELQRKLRAFVAFLNDSKGKPRELTLVFDYEPDKYYTVKLNGRVDPDRAIHNMKLDLPLIAHDPAAYAEANAYDPTETYMYDVGYVKRNSAIANFMGKVVGSTVENAHVSKHSTIQTSLGAPSVFTTEPPGGAITYNKLSRLDGDLTVVSSSNNGAIPQQLFSFNLIEHVERKYGFLIPGSSTADKVAWLKGNINKITCNWHGKGSGPNGNKAYFTAWNGTQWNGTPVSHSSSAITKLAWGINIQYYIMVDGFVHFLSYAEASNGTIASTIETDYVELIVETHSNVYFLEPDPTVNPMYFYDTGLMHDNPTEFQWTNSREYSGVHNYSSLETSLIIEIEGTVQNPEITNTLTGETLILPTLWSDKMTIDTGKFSIKVGKESKFADGDFFKLQPGDNSLLFTGDDPNATVRYKWKHKFL